LSRTTGFAPRRKWMGSPSRIIEDDEEFDDEDDGRQESATL
jgi:hypothetical protein